MFLVLTMVLLTCSKNTEDHDDGDDTVSTEHFSEDPEGLRPRVFVLIVLQYLNYLHRLGMHMR